MKGYLWTSGLEAARGEGSSNGHLAPWEAIAIDAVGNVIEFWGFKRNQGRVWALLYLRGEPLTAGEIERELDLSKGGVSMLLRDLERVQHLVATDAWMSAVRQIGNRMTVVLDLAMSVLSWHGPPIAGRRWPEDRRPGDAAATAGPALSGVGAGQHDGGERDLRAHPRRRGAVVPSRAPGQPCFCAGRSVVPTVSSSASWPEM